MRRRLFTSVSAVSLLLCVATCVLWVRSYSVSDGFVYRRDGRNLIGRIVSGGVAVVTTDGSDEADGFEVEGFRRLRWESPADWERTCDLPGAVP